MPAFAGAAFLYFIMCFPQLLGRVVRKRIRKLTKEVHYVRSFISCNILLAQRDVRRPLLVFLLSLCCLPCSELFWRLCVTEESHSSLDGFYLRSFVTFLTLWIFIIFLVFRLRIYSGGYLFHGLHFSGLGEIIRGGLNFYRPWPSGSRLVSRV